MGEQEKPRRNPLLKQMNLRKWRLPMKQVEDALAGNMDIDAPVSFFSRKQEQGERRPSS